MPKTAITTTPGIGKTFAKEFVRAGLHCVEDFEGKADTAVFEALAIANQQDNHKTTTRPAKTICT